MWIVGVLLVAIHLAAMTTAALDARDGLGTDDDA